MMGRRPKEEPRLAFRATLSDTKRYQQELRNAIRYHKKENLLISDDKEEEKFREQAIDSTLGEGTKTTVYIKMEGEKINAGNFEKFLRFVVRQRKEIIIDGRTIEPKDAFAALEDALDDIEAVAAKTAIARSREMIKIQRGEGASFDEE